MAKSSRSKARTSVEQRLEKCQRGWNGEVWGKKKGATKESPYDQPYSRLKRGVYALVRECLEHDLLDVLKESVEFQFGDRSQVKPSENNDTNPFYWGLTAVCGTENKLKRNSKSRFAQELLYAHMHDVPPQFLIGFLHQMGSSKGLQDKIENQEMQRWFVKRQKSAAAE